MAEIQQLVATSSDRQVNMARTTQPAGNLDDENQASKFVHDEEIQVQREEENSLAMKDQYWRYLPLFKAALRGDWDSAKRIFDQDEGAITARINTNFETALSVAVGTGEAGVHFVEKLVEMMPAKALALPSGQGNTALHTAALVGNTKAAVILVEKHSALLYIPGNFNYLPIHLAAQNAHKDTLQYLLSVTKDDPVSMPFAFQPGLTLFLEVIYSGFFDVAVNLVRRYPELARIRHYNGNSALEVIAAKESAFASGSRLNSWQRVIYKYAPVKLENYAKDHNRGDIENPINNCKVVAKKYRWARFAPFLQGNFSIPGSQKWQAMLWKVFELLVPRIKRIREQKLMHLQALQLVKCLCEEIGSLNDLDASALLIHDALLLAASAGIHEVVEEIVDSFPHHAWTTDSQNRNIFQWALICRCENVYNLIYQMGKHKQYVRQLRDGHENTILHLAGRLAPLNKLNLISGAALQMQRELQWFKEVEKFVLPSYIERKNIFGETPAMVFTNSHKELVVQGEKWMKDTANSCTIAATLIATIVFAAAITVPGGNNGSSGLPIFSREKTFICFVISDAISLFTSTTSLLMFLSILTARYAEGDFLYILPKRLIIGLVMLFLSVTSMMVAFSSTLYVVFGHGKPWILIPVALLACLPITSFVFLQFPLVVDLISSTYGPGIFGKQSNRPFY